MASVRRFVYILIPVFAILLMSHNTYAVATNLPLNNSTITWQGNNYGSSSFISGSTNTYDSSLGYSLGKNEINYLQFSIPAYINYNNFSNYVFTFRLVSLYDFTPVSNNNFPISDYYITSNECSDRYGFEITTQIVGDGFSSYGEYTEPIPAINCYTVVIKGLLRGDQTQGGIFVLGRWGEHSRLLQFFRGNIKPDNQLFPNSFIISPELKLFNSESESAADYALEKEKAETQSASDDSADSGEDSADDAETATSSLISVIGGFVNVLTTAQPTNCRINANLNHIDMGQLDLCANPVPSYIQIIGSIILICAAIPLAIVLFNRFIGLFRSFQG